MSSLPRAIARAMPIRHAPGATFTAGANGLPMSNRQAPATFSRRGQGPCDAQSVPAPPALSLPGHVRPDVQPTSARGLSAERGHVQLDAQWPRAPLGTFRDEGPAKERCPTSARPSSRFHAGDGHGTFDAQRRGAVPSTYSLQTKAVAIPKVRSGAFHASGPVMNRCPEVRLPLAPFTPPPTRPRYPGRIRGGTFQAGPTRRREPAVDRPALSPPAGKESP